MTERAAAIAVYHVPVVASLKFVPLLVATVRNTKIAVEMVSRVAFVAVGGAGAAAASCWTLCA